MSDHIPRLTTDETLRRLPAIQNIEDETIREETCRLSGAAPAYFWEVPASTSGYHHPACRGEHGLWAHTLMVAAALERHIDSYLQRSAPFDERDADCARAAALLHDQRKNGPRDDVADSSVSDHDILMGDVIREQSELPDAVAAAVDRHMGPWYDGPEPRSPLDRLVHTADMAASTSRLTVHLPEPVPEELADLGIGPLEDD